MLLLSINDFLVIKIVVEKVFKEFFKEELRRPVPAWRNQHGAQQLNNPIIEPRNSSITAGTKNMVRAGGGGG